MNTVTDELTHVDWAASIREHLENGHANFSREQVMALLRAVDDLSKQLESKGESVRGLEQELDVRQKFGKVMQRAAWRQYACTALQALVASGNYTRGEAIHGAYSIADDMLKAEQERFK